MDSTGSGWVCLPDVGSLHPVSRPQPGEQPEGSLLNCGLRLEHQLLDLSTALLQRARFVKPRLQPGLERFVRPSPDMFQASGVVTLIGLDCLAPLLYLHTAALNSLPYM